ncbi:MAG: hypothetical protein L6R41_004035 [Letrouitia leprolyta]|nr:MAG: hypothetical protein L6R41_004035 [Letrouitia leprolyta]
METRLEENDREDESNIERELKRQKSSGSVKRARERAAAGLSSKRRDPLEPAPLRVTPNRTPPRATTPSEQIIHAQSQPSEAGPPSWVHPSKSQHIPSPSTSSTVTPTTPNWPSVSDPAVGRIRSNSPVQESRTPRGPPPKRPPRPDYVPPLPSQSTGQQSGNYWEQDFITSTGGSGRTLGSPARSVPGTSSIGVPEFPIPLTPQTPHQPRRNLGPPPSARKGGANFYPQNAFVAPIPEEQSDTHSSFASSHVIPASWGDGPPEYYMGSGISEEDEEDVHSPSSTNDGRESRAGDHDESTGLVRKVSIGKPGKPALKSVRGEGTTDEHPRTGQEVQFGPGAGLPTFLTPSSNSNSPDSTPGERLADSKEDAGHPGSGTATPTPAMDPRVAKILGGLEKGGALSTGGTTPMISATPSMSDRGGKRPARLKLAGAESEPRGSATSLPELIRRATRLASNLDRGRTASRVGMLEMLEKEKSRRPSRSGSISDILAAFPSPSLATPQAQSPRFPSPLARSGLHKDYTVTTDQSDYSGQRRGRRCCGLPVWAFILLCIILLLLVAAAIIIPVTLIVLPRQNSNSAAGTVAGCEKSFPCGNGGISFLKADSCRCICANGFTGAACNTPADSGCTTTNVEANDESHTMYKNATLGTSIARLFASGNTDFSIPLDSSMLLSSFSFQNLTCTNENALVTFNGKPQRKRRRNSPSSLDFRRLKSDEQLISRHPTRASLLDARALANRASPAQAAITSNGLVYAAPSGASSPESPPSSSTPTSSSPSQSSPSSSINNTSSTKPASLPLTSNILDFARTAILFIFQERDLATAASAQENMQTLFTPAASGGEFNSTVRNVGAGITIDWAKLNIDFGNGTDFGGRGEGSKLSGGTSRGEERSKKGEI